MAFIISLFRHLFVQQGTVEQLLHGGGHDSLWVFDNLGWLSIHITWSTLTSHSETGWENDLALLWQHGWTKFWSFLRKGSFQWHGHATNCSVELNSETERGRGHRLHLEVHGRHLQVLHWCFRERLGTLGSSIFVSNLSILCPLVLMQQCQAPEPGQRSAWCSNTLLLRPLYLSPFSSKTHRMRSLTKVTASQWLGFRQGCRKSRINFIYRVSKRHWENLEPWSTLLNMDLKWGPEPINTQMEKVLPCLTTPSVQKPGRSLKRMCFHRPLAFSSAPPFGCFSHRFWQGTHWRGLHKFPSSHSPCLIINSSGESCWWSC